MWTWIQPAVDHSFQGYSNLGWSFLRHSFFLTRESVIWDEEGWRYALPLGYDVFGEHFDAVGGFKLADKSRIPAGQTGQRAGEDCAPVSIPEFTSDTKVLATPHQCVALASFGGGWYSRGVKVFLFAPCNPY